MPKYDPKTRKALQELGELVATAARELQAARKKKGTKGRKKKEGPKDVEIPICAHPENALWCRRPPPPPPGGPYIIRISLPPIVKPGKPGKGPGRPGTTRPGK